MHVSVWWRNNVCLMAQQCVLVSDDDATMYVGVRWHNNVLSGDDATIYMSDNVTMYVSEDDVTMYTSDDDVAT